MFAVLNRFLQTYVQNSEIIVPAIGWRGNGSIKLYQLLLDTYLRSLSRAWKQIGNILLLAEHMGITSRKKTRYIVRFPPFWFRVLFNWYPHTVAVNTLHLLKNPIHCLIVSIKPLTIFDIFMKNSVELYSDADIFKQPLKGYLKKNAFLFDIVCLTNYWHFMYIFLYSWQ